MPINALRRWFEAATMIDLDKLVKLAPMSKGALRQIAGSYRTGGVAHTTPEVARLIDIATHKMARDDLPGVKREELCPACAKCEYTKFYKEKQNEK